MAVANGLEVITYTIDNSIRARADYLRETKFEWPAISPEVIEKYPWLTKIPGGTPQFQAFALKGNQLVAITAPENSQEAILEALKHANL